MADAPVAESRAEKGSRTDVSGIHQKQADAFLPNYRPMRAGTCKLAQSLIMPSGKCGCVPPRLTLFELSREFHQTFSANFEEDP